MENKVLVKLILPELDDNFDVFIPVNEIIWKIKKLLIKAISDVTGFLLDNELEYVILNKDNGKVYDNNEIVVNTDIRNGTELLRGKAADSHDTIENLRRLSVKEYMRGGYSETDYTV